MPQVVVPLVIAGTTAYSINKTQQMQEEAQAEANKVAAQEAERAKTEQQRLEEKYGMTPGELEREDRMFELEKQRQTELQRRSGLSGEELLRELGPITSGLMDSISKRQGMSSEDIYKMEGGEAARLLLEELTKPGPLSTFEPELNLTLQGVQQSLGRRGLTPQGVSGDIGLEAMGRAGVDAAIKAAQQRIDARTALANTLYNIQASTRSEAGSVGERALTESERSRAELAQYLQDIQNLTQSSMGRASTVATNAANIYEPSISGAAQVPIAVAGQAAGQAAQNQSDIIGGLANAGGMILGDILTSKKSNLPETKPSIVEANKEREPVEELLQRSRGITNIPEFVPYKA